MGSVLTHPSLHVPVAYSQNELEARRALEGELARIKVERETTQFVAARGEREIGGEEKLGIERELREVIEAEFAQKLELANARRVEMEMKLGQAKQAVQQAKQDAQRAESLGKI